MSLKYGRQGRLKMISKSVVEDSVMREHNGNQSAVVIMMPYGVHSEEQI